MSDIKTGVCAPLGFVANGIHCGIRKSAKKKDLALVVSQVKAAAAAVYTTNKVYGAPITVTRENIKNGFARAFVCNSGNANTCNADGVEKARAMCALTGAAADIDPSDVIVASTGVIGQTLDIEPIRAGMAELASGLSSSGGHDAATAIMTTDTMPKEVALSVTLGGKTATIGACAKGSGMIHPNMATMLCFVTTDAAISPALLQKALSAVVQDTFNMVSVDGDTSTNDMVAVLANGMAGNPVIDTENDDYRAFTAALFDVSAKMAKKIASDGEGATRLLTVNVKNAPDIALAKSIAKSVVTSSLVKTAVFGADANWGRVLCAIGYTQGEFAVDTVDVSLSSEAGIIEVCKDGAGVAFSEEIAKAILLKDAIAIDIDMKQGEASATAWGCDLTYDYVKINGDYRT